MRLAIRESPVAPVALLSHCLGWRLVLVDLEGLNLVEGLLQGEGRVEQHLLCANAASTAN